MAYSPRFPRAERALDEIEAAALAQEALDAARWALSAKKPEVDEHSSFDTPLLTEQAAEALAPAGPERVLHVEHVLIAAIWLGSIGLGLFRLLM
jgi:hypothetical protein